ncbi:MAG: acyl--CoA ligase [Hyphomicrobiaceae bacterium]|nr:acyl--CoA ligase [Hyphomicrobiaceae bacterium]
MTAERPSPQYSAALPPARFNMAAYTIGRAAAAKPGALALEVLDQPGASVPAERWTFGEIERAVLAISAGLRARDLAPGDRILIRLENTSAYALTFFGAIAAGLVPLATSTHLTEREAAFLVTDSGARAVALSDNLPHPGTGDAARGSDARSLDVIRAEDIARMIRDGAVATAARSGYADTAADDPAYMVYTSGTTANPKGVLHAQRAAWGRRPMYAGWYGMTSSDRMLHAGAFNWTFTLGTGLTDPWANGATAIVYTGEKDASLWPRLISQSGATLFAAVPSLYRQILKYAPAAALANLGDLRHGLMAGETPPENIFELWRSATSRDLHEALGMSEISTYVSTAPGIPRRPGSVGRPQPGRAVCILPEDGGEKPLPAGEVGLLAVHRSDPGLMLGYWQRPQEEAAVVRGEWFIGGDLATMDEDGYVTHKGRANDVMKALGYRVAPQEIEAVLARHPGVAEVACAEHRVRADLAIIAAYVVARDPGCPPSADALATFAAAHLAPYKQPREIIFVDHLPRTANGKVMRRALR